MLSFYPGWNKNSSRSRS